MIGSATGVEPPATAAEPRVLSFMFTDIVDSTALLSRLGETHMETLRQAHFELLRRELATWGGQEVKNLGDGLMAIFASPSEAVACAVAMQRAVQRRNRMHGESVHVRIGIDIGESSHDGGDWFGGPVVLAKRLCDAAEPDGILVSDVAHLLAAPRSAHGFGEPQALQLKGLPGARTAFAVAWQAARTTALSLPPALAARENERTRFVGRSAECTRLRDIVDSLSGGGRRLVLIAGEPGIGKTRLAMEVALEVHRRGGLVLWGSVSENVRVPYEPVIEALHHYVVSTPSDVLREQVGDDASALVRIVPELADRLPGLHAVAGDDNETERFRLFNAVCGLLGQLASGAPALLVLDDLQWADRATLLLLRHLLRTDVDGSLLLLGTYRDTEVSRSHPLADLVADLSRAGAGERLALTGLVEDDVAAIVEAITGWSPSAQFARALHAETRGNALYVEEMVRHLRDTGGVSAAGLSDAARRDLAGTGVPESVKEVLWRRFRRLPSETVELLQVGSVIGVEISADLLAELVPDAAGRIVPLLDPAVTSGLLEEQPDRLGVYRFSHALVQQALQEEHTHNRRAWLHVRIAEAIEKLHTDDLSPYFAELAHHYESAGEMLTAKVVAFARAASERALAMLAYEDAQLECTTALRALDVCAPDDSSQRAELLVLLGTTQLRSGDTPAAKQTFARAAEFARQAGAAPILARAALGYGSSAGFGGVWVTYAAVDGVLVGLLEEALAAGDDLDAPMRARLLGRLAQALYWSDDKERMRDLSAQALDMARDAHDDTAIAYALDSRHVALWDPDHLVEREPIAEVMLGIGDRQGDRDIQLEAYAWLITDLLELGQIARVRAHVEEHAAIAQELRQPYHLWYTAAARAMLAHLEGRFDDMERLVDEAWHHGETAHGDNARQTFMVQTLFLRRERGQLDDFIPGLEAHVEQSPLVHGWRAALTAAYTALGREREALQQLRVLGADGFAGIPRDCIWLAVLSMLAEAVCSFDAREHAEPLYRLMLPYESRVIVVGGAVLCFGPVPLFLGMLARVLGDAELSRTHLERALAQCTELGSPPLIARTRAELARVAS